MLRAPLRSASCAPQLGQIDGVLPWPGAAGAAGVAGDAGVAGVHADHSSSGAFSLGDEGARELPPAGVQDRPVEPGLLRDVPPGFRGGTTSRGGQAVDMKVLQRQHVVGVDQGMGGLVVEVAPLVTDLAPLLGERPPEPLAIAGAEPGAFLAALQAGDLCLRGGEEPRVGDDDTVAGGEEPCHPDVDADCATGGWERLGVRFGDDDHVPTAILPIELQRLYLALDWPMLLDLEVSDRLEGRVCPAVGVGRLPLGAVSGDEQHLVEPLVGLEPRVADLAVLVS